MQQEKKCFVTISKETLSLVSEINFVGVLWKQEIVIDFGRFLGKSSVAQ